MSKTVDDNIFVKVKGRFHRSVQLEKDWQTRTDLSDYVLTPTVVALTERIISEAQRKGGIRAWSVTGPYGTGKSSFALFLSRIFSAHKDAHPDAEAYVNKLASAPYLPVLLVGQRVSLKTALLQALALALRAFDQSKAKAIANDIRLHLDKPLSDDLVLSHFERALEVAASSNSGGLLVVLDEFGKFLEHSAQHADDLLIMQSLAEMAARSETSFILVTILHTGFAEYLDTFDEVRRAEWQKVQGRFTDVAFQEPPEQLLKLLGNALETSFPTELRTAYRRECEKCITSEALRDTRARLPLDDLLAACAPLHPLTALLLWPLFRGKLAQNERSLFVFLTSHEPYGLQDFLHHKEFHPHTNEAPFYRLEWLYDYIKISLGAGLYRGEAGRRWAELETTLDRIGADAPAKSVAVLKALGLLWLYGAPLGLRATEEAIALAVGDASGVRQALIYLQERSIIIYRRYEGAFGLWEGSDVDLGALFEKARQQLTTGNLATRLSALLELRPVVARAHYIKTGTLRYFSVDVTSSQDSLLDEQLNTDNSLVNADGRIIYVLSPISASSVQAKLERQTLIDRAKELTSGLATTEKPVIFVFPQPLTGLEEALTTLESWQQVRDNTPALQGDRAAKRELSVRLEHAEQRLENVIGSVFGVRGQRLAAEQLTWVYLGKEHAITDARTFTSWLSSICETVYCQAAPLHNELLNREQLSSASKAALNRLIKGLVSKPNSFRFGFEGTPAEVSMYASLFAQGGFHREVAAECWTLSAPNENWRDIWKAIKSFLEETKTGRKPLLELYDLLKRPPYGMRQGPLPLLICTMLLLKKEDVVLYYNGLFQPELYEETLELLVRVPESFEVQQIDLSGESKVVLSAISEALDSLALTDNSLSEDDAPLLRLVRPLILTVAKLPTYSKNTTRLDPPQAAALRNATLKAKDPHQLLFQDIPDILGLRAEADPQAFARVLRSCIWALQRAYPDLLDTLEQHLKYTFDLSGQSATALRDELQTRALPLRGYSSDPTLTLFINEASRESTKDWREALGRAVLKGKPPTTWNDADLATFQISLTRLASDFMRLEELVAERQESGAERIIRVGILDKQLSEVRQTISLHPEREADVKKLASELEGVLKNFHDARNSSHVIVAALAQVVADHLGGRRQDDDNT